MELKILIVERQPENFAIELCPDDGVTVTLQEGYRTPAQAVQALVEALSFAPPDMGMYDESVSQVSTLIDARRDADEAIMQMNERLQNCEDAISTLAVAQPAAPRQNPLLAGRSPRVPPSPAPGVPERPASPPPIRRQTMGAGTRAGMIVGGVRGGRFVQAEIEPEGQDEF